MGAAHELQLVAARCQSLHDVHGLRALQCQQRQFGAGYDLAACTDMRGDMGHVRHLAGAVDHYEQVAAMGYIAVDEHQIVQNTAGVVEQQAVALLADRKVDHVHRNQRFQCGRGLWPAKAQLTHVGDIEQAGCMARVLVFGHDPGRVLNRHAVAGKRHHARAEFQMQVVQGCAEQGFCRSGQEASPGAMDNHGLTMGCPAVPGT